MGYALLADVVVAFHVAYVSFILFGQLGIFVGMLLKWAWIRNFWFRIAHLTAISIVALEAIFGIACPLTVWENNLREAANEAVQEGTFVGRFLDHILYHPMPPGFYTTCYITFALLVVTTFLLAPPRRRRVTLPA